MYSGSGCPTPTMTVTVRIGSSKTPIHGNSVGLNSQSSSSDVLHRPLTLTFLRSRFALLVLLSAATAATGARGGWCQARRPPVVIRIPVSGAVATTVEIHSVPPSKSQFSHFAAISKAFTITIMSFYDDFGP